LQNIRFLYSTSNSKINYTYELNLRLSSVYVYYATSVVFFFLFGIFFFDDFLLYFNWIFS
jgi:hypothetical protein